MSRCFPFPPPGYERKHGSEDLDLLKEIKCKEKKHKKEKRNHERKKERENERGGSSERHREKKERKGKHKEKKEKHRDKKDKEDRGKDKDKSSISEESTVARDEGKNSEKLYPLGNSKDRSKIESEGKCPPTLQVQNGGKHSQNNLPSLGYESKFIQDLDGRIRDEKSRGSQLPEKLAVEPQPMVNSSDVVAGKRDDNKNKCENTTAHKLMPILNSKSERIPRPVSEENGSVLEGKEKCRMGKYEKTKIQNENKKGSELGKLKDEHKDRLGGHRSTGVLNGFNSNTVKEGYITKRKDMGTNGFLHEREIRPTKTQRSSSPHQLTENKRKIEPSRTLAKASNDKEAVANSVGVDDNNRVTNGLFEAQKPSASIPIPHAATVQIAEASISKLPRHYSNTPKTEVVIPEASSRCPHPDSKYLNEVLRVPKNMAHWGENDDDQLWLFSERVPRKPKLESFSEGVQVWSEAVHIESADVCALPYVVPY